MKYIKWFEEAGSGEVSQVGGKNASLGEMISQLKGQDIRIPDGFATTSEAYRLVVKENDIEDQLKNTFKEFENDNISLEKTGRKIRRLFTKASIPDELEKELKKAYQELSRKYKSDEADVAVRSSATAEDLPEASFAGQQETFLNVTGEEELLEAFRKCYASLFTDRAISYRREKGFDHLKIALSVGVQKMVRADKAGSGVMFSLDTETGFRDVVVINAAWGLGENVVQGSVNPDEYRVFKPLLGKKDLQPVIQKELGSKEKKMVYAGGGSRDTKNVETSKNERAGYVLNDDEILKLAEWAVVIEEHYDKPMDMEWAKDGESGDLFIVQARPETVQSLKTAGQMKAYRLKEKGKKIIEGLAIGEAVAAGKSQIIKDPDQIDRFQKNAILVTGQTDPDWVPIMKKASGIVTDHGGRTSHAAIVSRELGIPAVVGTGEATSSLKDGSEITLSCVEGDKGIVYEGILDFEEKEVDLEKIPETRTRIMMNIASPAAAFRWWRLRTQGIGLARMEFIINNIIKIHPMALVDFDSLSDKKAKHDIETLTRGFDNKGDYFVEHLS
ncbi:MAG: phosphoenolpyruvate synthase, partial [Candidatus Aminicenantaceae bacterium]